MSPRLGFWLSGFVIACVLARGTSDDTFPGARVIVAGGAFLLIGVSGEIVSELRARRQPLPTIDDRLADGRVEIAGVHDVRSEPNRNDERFGRFLGLIGNSEPVAMKSSMENTRVCPPLLGRIAIVSLFVGRDRRGWSERELADAHEVLLRAGEWIEHEALRYGAGVNVEIAETYFVYDDETPDEVAIGFQAEGDSVGPFEQEAGLKALVGVTRAAVASGFRDASDMFADISGRIAADVTVWLIHPRQSGRSFALPSDHSGWAGLSLAVCFPREASFPEPISGPARVDSVTVVHELLHLFGASDKYARPLRAFTPKTVTSREVMRLDETRLSRLRIDPSTASEVGWMEKLRER